MLVQKMCTKYKHLFIFRCLEVLEKSPSIHTVDITGGAPELCPEFRYLVEGVNQLKKRVIDRCNLTVLLEPGKFISLIESDNLALFLVLFLQFYFSLSLGLGYSWEMPLGRIWQRAIQCGITYVVTGTQRAKLSSKSRQL